MDLASVAGARSVFHMAIVSLSHRPPCLRSHWQASRGHFLSIRKHGITDALLVPEDVESLHKHLGPTGHDHISTLKHIYVSSAPIKGFHYQSLSKLLSKEAKMARMMGITECTGFIFGLPWPDTHTEQQADQGWVGQLLVSNAHTKYTDDSL